MPLMRLHKKCGGSCVICSKPACDTIEYDHSSFLQACGVCLLTFCNNCGIQRSPRWPLLQDCPECYKNKCSLADVNAQRLLQELEEEKEEAEEKTKGKSRRKKKTKAPMDESAGDSEAGSPAGLFPLRLPMEKQETQKQFVDTEDDVTTARQEAASEWQEVCTNRSAVENRRVNTLGGDGAMGAATALVVEDDAASETLSEEMQVMLLGLLKPNPRTVEGVRPAPQALATAPACVAATSGAADDTECCVCMEANKTHILIPCGHVCVCETCADTIMATTKICPVCRAVSQQVCKVFL